MKVATNLPNKVDTDKHCLSGIPNVTFEVSQCENLLGYLRIELGSAVNSDGLNTYWFGRRYAYSCECYL